MNTTLFFIIGLSFAVLINPIKMILSGSQSSYRQQKKYIENIIYCDTLPKVVVSNDVQKRLGEYYNRCNENNAAIFLNYNEFDPDSNLKADIYLVKNYHTRALSNLSHDELPLYAQKAAKTNQQLVDDKKNGIFIFKMRDFSATQVVDTLCVSCLDYESKADCWGIKQKQLVAVPAYEGKFAEKVIEYSSTFTYPLDSIDRKKYTKVILSFSSMFQLIEEANPKMVLTLEQKGESLFWKAKEIPKFNKAFGNWWPANGSYEIPLPENTGQAMLKLYLWNPEKKEIYLDNMKIWIVGTE